MKGMALAITSIALALGTFMQVLDTTIANVSLPTIAGNLGASTDQGTWVITSFAVANGVAVPLTGWLMQRYGVVRTFVFSVLLFTLASFLCGIAWSLPALILFRILQGAVSGPMIPGSQALLISIFPPQKRATALGIWSITTLVAPILGPILGGYISDNYPLELDLPHQRAGGIDRGVPVLDQSLQPRDADAPASHRHGRPWRCWSSGSARCRSCSTPARMRTGSPPRRSWSRRSSRSSASSPG